MNLLRYALFLPVVFALPACEREPELPCPLAGPELWEPAIRSYFERYPPEDGPDAVKILEYPSYSSTLPGWMVDVEVPGSKYIALVSCSGYVEISGGDPY